MTLDITIFAPSSNPHCRRPDAAMCPPGGATVTRSGAAAISVACTSIGRNQIIGCGCSCVDTIPLGHQAFGGLRNDRDAIACHIRCLRSSRLGSDIRPAVATELILDSILSREASRVTASPDKTFRDMTAHGTTVTTLIRAYAKSVGRSKRHHPRVVFAWEMLSPVELCRRNLGQGVRGW
jgi:hypothetical protein